MRRRVCINIAVIFVTIVIGFVVTRWLDNAVVITPAVPNETALSGDMVPDFTITDTAQKKHAIKDYRGHVVVLNFWATWCAPCLIEFPKLAMLAQKNPDMIVLALSGDADDATLTRFLDKYKLPANMIVARDVRHKITGDLFQTYKLPETILIDRKGQMVKKIAGDTDWLGPEMTGFLGKI